MNKTTVFVVIALAALGAVGVMATMMTSATTADARHSVCPLVDQGEMALVCVPHTDGKGIVCKEGLSCKFPGPPSE